MLQTLTTMVSLLLSAGAAGVIGVSLWEDRQALRRALMLSGSVVPLPLPPHTHRVAGARRARFVTLPVQTTGLRAAA